MEKELTNHEVGQRQRVAFHRLLGPRPHLPPFSFEPPHSLLPPLSSHFT